MATEPALVLYHTSGCHLCELAEALLMPLAAAAGRPVVLTEIAGDDDLEARYGIRIPVLQDAASGREIGWPFDETAVLALIAGG